MPVNRYDVAQGQRYVSTYVPLPFEELAAIGAKKQKDADHLLDLTDKAKGMLNIKADPKNIAYRDKLQKEYNDKLTSVSEKIIKEGYTPENRSLVNQTINSITNDPNRLELEKSYQHYGEYQKDAQKNQQERKYWEKYDPYMTGPKGSESNVTPFTYQGMKTKGDYIPDMQKLIDQIAKDSEASEGYRKDNSGKLIMNEQGQIQKSDNSWENITESKVYNLAKTLAPTFFRTKDANWFIDERMGQNSGKDYAHLSTEKNIEIPVQESYKDPKTGKKSIRTVNKKFSERELMEEEAANEMFRIGSPQIFSNYKQGVDLQNLSEHALKKQDEEVNMGLLPQYRNPTALPAEKITPKAGLNFFGIETNILDDNNEITSGGFMATKFTVTDKNGKKSVYYNSIDAHNAAGVSGAIKEETATKEDAVKQLSETYTSASNIAKSLGIKIPKDSKGGNDYKKLLSILSEYGQNQMLTNNTSEGLQARISNNVSSKLLGTVDVDKNGDTKFKASPILSASKITEQGTGANVDNKEEIAQDGVITGINYFAKDPGTYRMDSKNKAYDVNPNEQVLKKMTENTHALTQRVVQARKGKATGNDLYDNNRTIKQAAFDIQNKVLEPYKNIPANDPVGMELAKVTQSSFDAVKNAEPISINYSDIRLPDGSPKYQYITYQEKHIGDPSDPQNNQTTEKVVRINREHGAVETVSLGDVQQLESKEVQQKYLSGAYEKAK